MSKPKRGISAEQPDALFGRVVSILEQAQGNVVRAVNTNMVLAYWLIGREIVEELQGGEERAEYGKKVIEELSSRLTERYGQGFSVQTLWKFRLFYRVYSDRIQILSPSGRESGDTGKMSPSGIEFPKISPADAGSIRHPTSGDLTQLMKSYPAGTESLQGFSPQLTWSHYRALMRVENVAARDFYEREAAECGWSKMQLEQQIHSFYYDRIVANRGEQGLLPEGRERLPGERVEPSHLLKSPMVLEFLGLPDAHELHESRLEQAIIDNLQNFKPKAKP